MRRHQHTRVALALLPLLAALMPLATATEVQAAPALPKVAKANPNVSMDVIKSLPKAVQDSDVQIMSEINKDTIIYYPDGTLVPGQSAEKVARAAKAEQAAKSAGVTAALAGCGQWTAFYGAPGAWGPESRSNCAVFGSKGYRRGYTWDAATGVYTSAAVQVLGFKCANYVELPIAGSDCGPHGYVGNWVGIGSGKSGSGVVFWGNVLANPGAKAFSLGFPAGYSGYWI